MSALPPDACARHYDEFLGKEYVWLGGGFEAAKEASRKELEALGLDHWPRGRAVDLGCGPGAQSLVLAQQGFAVTAIDRCPVLLAELEQRKGAAAIRPLRADLTEFIGLIEKPADLILCWGDTLTHLSSTGEVEAVIRSAARTLVPGGRLVLGFRDLSAGAEAVQVIPVRQEADRLFTCVLHFGDERVLVTDILQSRGPDGWSTRASSYQKLRLSAGRVAALVERSGLAIEASTSKAGAVRIVAVRKPPVD